MYRAYYYGNADISFSFQSLHQDYFFQGIDNLYKDHTPSFKRLFMYVCVINPHFFQCSMRARLIPHSVGISVDDFVLGHKRKKENQEKEIIFQTAYIIMLDTDRIIAFQCGRAQELTSHGGNCCSKR